jgi:hypothetical protein
MHLWDLRRFAHFALLVMLIVVIRACGGATQAEDRLSFATRWAAEKAGLRGATDTLDTSVKPRMAAATQSMTYTIYAATASIMDRTEMAISGMATWVGQQVSNAETAIERRLRSILGADAETQPQPEAAPKDKDPTTSSSR